MTDFDPAQHRMVSEQRWFEDFVLGERFVIPSRTQTSAVFAAFQTASGDTHPIHYDVEYCRARGMPDLLAHGFQTLVHTAPGAGLFPYIVEELLVGFLEQSSKFLKPVYAGDTIYPALEVTELVPGRIDRRGDAALDRVQPAQGAGAGRDAEIPDPAAARIERAADPAGRKNARKLRLFANVAGLEGCRTGPPALTSTNHEIP